MTSVAEGEALEAPFSDDDKRAFWLHVGAEPNSSMLATVITAVIIASATIMFLTVAV